MTWGEILGLAVTFVIVAGLAAVLVGLWAIDRMERYQRELEGVEIDSGQVHDVDPRA